MASFGGDPFGTKPSPQPANQGTAPRPQSAPQSAPQPAPQGGGASFGATMGTMGGGAMGSASFGGGQPALAGFGGAPQQPAPVAAKDIIKDSSTASFMADVIEGSYAQPVIVDFWATWCGPCKQLGPLLEKIVLEQQGRVKLVKIDVDQNKELASQMRIQSIPAVYAFKDGRPVDGFMGALPESQLRQFVDALAGGPSPAEQGLAEALAEAEAMAKEGDLATAAAIYAEVLAQDPKNVEAIAGLARTYVAAGELEQAKGALAQYKPEGGQAEPAAIAAVRAQIELAEQSGAKAGELDKLKAAVAADPGDHQARVDLAIAYFAAGDPQGAVDELLESIRRKRDWNEGAARAQLIKIFEALGPTHEVTTGGRRRLSSILFS